MKSMEQHGIPLASYSGVGNVRFVDNETITHAKGYFEAAQFPSGRLMVSFVSTEPLRPSPSVGEERLEDGLFFSGDDVDGRSIESEEGVFFPRLSWLFAPMYRHPSELNFYPRRLIIKSRGVFEAGYSRVRFLISNFLWHDLQGPVPELIKFTTREFSVTVDPVVDYPEVAKRLAAEKGVEPSAYVTIETKGGGLLPMDRFTDFADSVIYLFRLVSGNRVNWYHGDVLDGSTGKILDGVYNYAETASYSNTVRLSPLRAGYQSGVPKVDLMRLAEAFLGAGDTVIDRSTLRSLIDHFTNSCDDGSYLEARGLMASSLTELLAAKYADLNGFSEVVPEHEFEQELFPMLESAVGEAQLSKQFRDHVLSYLKGAFRRSFRSRLRRMVADLELPLEDPELGRIVETRNSLVHRGTFPSRIEDGGWLSDYRLLTWTNFSILCRLVGYQGQLPWRQEGRRWEV